MSTTGPGKQASSPRRPAGSDGERSLLIRPADLSFPTPVEGLFGRPGGITVEIGIGNGLFIADLAATHPDWNIVGLELSPSSVTRAFRRLRREGAGHARLFLGDARFFVRNVAPPQSFRRVFVNFPDPWPRAKHRDRRLMQAPFLKLLSSRLEEGGQVLFTTDHEEYFDFALAEAASTGLYDIQPGPPPAETLRTKYARKWASRDRSFFHAAFVRAGEAPPYEPALVVCETMHHAMLDGPLPALESFETSVHPFPDGHVVLREVYRSLDARGLLFLVHVEEPELTQEIIIEARPARNGYFVGVKRFGMPLQTQGVRTAVDAVTTWLEERGMRVRHRRY